MGNKLLESRKTKNKLRKNGNLLLCKSIILKYWAPKCLKKVLLTGHEVSLEYLEQL